MKNDRKLLEQALNLLESEWPEGDEIAQPVIDAIREALAEPEITTPDVCGEVCARAKLCYGCNKAFDEALADHVEQSLTMVAEHKCGGCAKKSADGWALYCVECWEKAERVNVDAVNTSGKRVDETGNNRHEPVQQEPVELGYCRAEKMCRAWCGNSACVSNQAAPVDAKAIQAEAYQQGRSDMKEEAAKVCDAIEQDRWNLYKGRPPYTGSEAGRADPHEQGVSMGAGECAAAIRGLK